MSWSYHYKIEVAPFVSLNDLAAETSSAAQRVQLCPLH